MKRPWLNAIAATVMILGVTACAQTQREREIARAPAAPRMETVSEDGFREWAVVIEGQPIQTLLVDRAKARGILIDMLDRDYNDEQLAELLARIKQDGTTAAELPEALTGIGGFATGQLLEAYLTSEPPKVRGKIRKYYFNNDRKSGYLEVNTEVDTLSNGAVANTDKYFWAVAVRPDTFEVRDRQEDAAHFPDNPFPDTVVFPSFATDPNDPQGRSIWQRNLDQKLWAKGKGVVVVAVIKNGTLLDTTDYRYTPTDASCIDLMFWGYPPESELPAQPAYCLGRCDHPQIVNTE